MSLFLNMSFDDIYKPIIDDIDAGKNILLLGPAGTGKSTFMKKLHECALPSSNIVVLSTTGMGALLINGQTVHSFFELSPKFDPKESPKRFSKVKKQIILNTDLIIIDEVSMLRSDVFQKIDRLLRYNFSSESPFGGKQILLVGDLLQLPPVVTKQEKEFFTGGKFFKSEYFFDTKSFTNGNFELHEFTKIFRQDDLEFINNLNEIRKGNKSNKILKFFNNHTIYAKDINEQQLPILITSKNANAEEINNNFLDEIFSDSITYEAIFTGKADREANYPSPKELTLKVGARVFITKNSQSENLVNGSFGEVKDFNQFVVFVKLDLGGKIIEVKRQEWQIHEYVLKEVEGEKPTIEVETVGTFAQMPLKLAYAITIHKSQGQTFDGAMIDLNDVFMPSQAYVALSRCKSVKNLYLMDNILNRHIFIDKRVSDFLETYKKNKIKNYSFSTESDDFFDI